MHLTFSEIVALVLGTMLGLRMLFMLIMPKAHRPLAFNLYNQRGVTAKRIFYIAVSVVCSYLLIKDTSIVYFILAAFAIGAVWDLYNTFFQYPEVSEVESLVKAGKPIPIYIVPKPTRNTIQAFVILGFVAWMYIYIFLYR